MSAGAKKWITLTVLVYLLIVSVVLLNVYPSSVIGMSVLEDLAADTAAALPDTAEEPGRLDLMFSHSGHFYDEDIEVSIFASVPDAVIYYTIDGSEPTTGSPVYGKPVHFAAARGGADIGVYPLKAIAVLGDDITKPLVHTYFIASDIQSRFDVMVFSLSTNDEHLYGYDTGILVEGRTREEYIAANPRVRIEPPAPANFNWRGMEGERPVFVEVFEPDGQRVIAQAAGVRTHGGWSRAANYKSLRLIARNLYDSEGGRFKYDFFPDDVKADGYGSPITRYDQLILSNNANDRDFAMLRQEVNYTLARRAGLRECSPLRGAAVFLNGEYYGFAWLEVSVNEQYLEELYSAPAREFQIVGNGELWIETDDTEERAALEHFNSYFRKDFKDDSVMAEFEALVDIDDLMLYYAYQTYVGNRDWPNNNLKRWRYTGPQEDEYGGKPANLAPELDGRWRFVTYDLDFLMSLYEDNVRADSPSFKDFLTKNNPRYSFMLDALFVRPDMADKYAMYICDIASNIVTAENVSELIDLYYGEMHRELGFALATRKYSGWVSRGSVEFNHANMIKYTQERKEYFLGAIADYFGWDDTFFSVEVSGANAIIGTQPGTSSTYFAHLEIPVRPDLDRYEIFDYWVLNGKVLDTPEITVSDADAVEGVVKIELVTAISEPSLQIKEAYGSSGRNGAVLYNASNEIMDTAGLYLTDDLSNPWLWTIPQATVAPGGFLEFAGRGSRDASDILKIQMSFNAREGRVLFLCNEAGEVLDWMAVSAAEK